MNENNRVLKTSFFFDLDHAVPELADFISNYGHSGVVMAVLCQEAMPAANEIARRLGLSLSFSTVHLKTKPLNGYDVPISFTKESFRQLYLA